MAIKQNIPLTPESLFEIKMLTHNIDNTDFQLGILDSSRGIVDQDFLLFFEVED